MQPKRLKILIIGLALMIFGPVIGWVLTIAGFFHAATSVAQVTPGNLQDMQQSYQHTASQMIYSIIPILFGALCGAVGFFLFFYALITHFFRPKPDA
jgi:VanZ family protein